VKKKVLLIYTELGFAGSYVIQPPISLVYVATHLVNHPDLEVQIIDCRIEKDWKRHLEQILTQEDVLFAGFFVMSGLQVAKAHEVSCLIKEISPNVSIVWGGPHPTILPEEVLNYGNIDFCIRGFGADALEQLTLKLLDGKKNFETISNACFIRNEKNITGQINSHYERLHFSKLPYHLLDPHIEKYFEGKHERDFPIYTAFGCPYQCNYCISPIWFKDTKKKWDPLPAEEVVDHMEFLIERYAINFFYFWDDDTFVSPSHFSNIAKEILFRGLKVGIGVRGIRANEVDRMKPKDFELLEAVGVKYLHIGIENGSQKILNIMQKGIKIEQSIETNRKLAKSDNIIPMYNMLCGVPTETLEDLKQTGLFMLQIAEENPNCIIFDPGKLIPYPGGAAYDLAVAHGYVPPKTPADWNKLDQEEDIYQPWYTPEYNRYINMLQVVSYALSNWEKYLENYPMGLQIMFKIFKKLYKPIAKFRIKHALSSCLIEYPLLNYAKQSLLKGNSE